MTVNTATELAYKNGYEAGREQALNELIRSLDSERPTNPTDPYDIGYNNGLVMAQAITIKLKGGKDATD